MTVRTFVRPTSTGIVIEVTPEELDQHEGLFSELAHIAKEAR